MFGSQDELVLWCNEHPQPRGEKREYFIGDPRNYNPMGDFEYVPNNIYATETVTCDRLPTST